MVFVFALAAAWVAFTFGVCVGDFFESELQSIRPADWYKDTGNDAPEKPKVMTAAA